MLMGYTRGVGEAVSMGDDVESGIAGKFKGDRANGGSGREGGEVQGPEAVPRVPCGRQGKEGLCGRCGW
jgi:hypothetical protein